MSQAITPVLNHLETNASSQAEYLAKQSLALERLLEKHCPPDLSALAASDSLSAQAAPTSPDTLTPAPTVPHQKMSLF